MSTYGLNLWHSSAQSLGDPHREQREQERMLAGATDDARIRINLVQALANLRQALKITQKRVATLMGTQQSAVSDLEKGVTDPRLSTLQRYARAIGCTITVQIVEEFDDPHSAAARSLIHYSSWRHTDAPTYQSNVRLAIDDAAAQPWQWLLEERDLSTLDEEQLAAHLRWSEPYVHPKPDRVPMAGMRPAIG